MARYNYKWPNGINIHLCNWIMTPFYMAAIFFIFFFIVNLLPILILHFQYLKENSNSILFCNRVKQEMKYINLLAELISQRMFNSAHWLVVYKLV